MEVITDAHLELEMSLVLWCQGDDPSGGVSREEQLALNRELTAQAQELVQPAIVYDLFSLREVMDGVIVLEGGYAFHGNLLAERFGPVKEVALALCTIGGALEQQVSVYREEGDAIRAVLLDGIGTAAVGELAEKANELIRKVACEKGWKASAPFQPGQIDWPLEDHTVFFDLLPADKLGLRLDSNHLMIPCKSVSMAIGLGEEMLPLAMERACRYCPIGDQCRFSHDRLSEVLSKQSP
ncbi:MAG: hypothetical protein GTO63_31085 [Anaerolineae bacterium]|nr:hypothetical protein [Anaerolineae bacterium]NIN99137.1 hypothetical protein [Anaerolineae bacterium]NIQ81978.1 hypothetical protein [Anaerolineae bacterium]